MPRVVLHEDTVCLWGGQLGGEDINRVLGALREWRWGKRSREENMMRLWERLYLISYSVLCYKTQIEIGLL